MTELFSTLEELSKLTKTNLGKQFENLDNFANEAVHYANRCDITLSLKSLAFSELAAHVLREDAQRNYQQGLITLNELGGIYDKSSDIVIRYLTEEISNALVKSCDCRKA